MFLKIRNVISVAKIELKILFLRPGREEERPVGRGSFL